MIVDKTDYLDIVENFLNDTRKLGRINQKNDGILSLAVNQKKLVDNTLENLVTSNSTSVGKRRSLKPVGTRPGTTHGLRKVHKDINCPPFRPILSTINTPTYKLAKFLVPLLKSLTSNEYTVKDSFAFAEQSVEQYSEVFHGKPRC